jgi:hypothetical protein
MAENGIPLIGTIASIGSGLIGGIGSYLAARETAGAIKQAANVERQNFTDSLAALQPQISAGNTAREFQLGALGLPGGNSDAINLWRQSPGYTAALSTGKNAVQTSAAAGGNLFSGKTLKDLASFGQGLEDQTFGQWYDRLGGLSGAGGAATGQAVNLGAATAGNLADLAVRGGDARASSYIGGANAAIGGLQNLADLYAYYNPPAGAGVPAYRAGGIGRA